jgi:uncharacterized ferredoxin-like protein
MAPSGQIQKSKTKAPKKKEQDEKEPEVLSKEKKQKLKELDEYIEGVLEEAGEDFLDQFKQVEGQ